MLPTLNVMHCFPISTAKESKAGIGPDANMGWIIIVDSNSKCIAQHGYAEILAMDESHLQQ